jgi:protein FRG1
VSLATIVLKGSKLNHLLNSGTFLTAASSGVLSASTPSRGPLEAFVPIMTVGSSIHPTLSLKTSSDHYLSISINAEKLTLGKPQIELRADADEVGQMEGFRIKCQRDFVNKARADLAGGPKGKKRNTESGRTIDIEGTLEDERERKYVREIPPSLILNQRG